ncbi:hypothetical protein GCM10010121_097100 [Streptomyces brasiliensis]|uniref:Uncharacterized protein n=1 Tax=Streptomyces brasiliensis TaxID=1954 RepID=A0A917PCK1_9ACTN|nr:hypothetical protein GCM10010121_097100 [Streptomyces brasiliensis]
MRRTRALQFVWYAIGGGLLIASLASHLHGWRVWGEAAAFYLGAGGAGFLFLQWRRQGNVAARAWFLAAVGTWALGVMVYTATSAAGLIILGLALSIGLVGALTERFRAARGKQAMQPEID